MGEPKELFMGVDSSWIRNIEDIEGATYQYKFLARDGSFLVDGVAGGSVLSVSVLADQTAEWRAGKFKWFLTMDVDGSKTHLDSGFSTVVDSVENMEFLEVETHAERMLSIIEKKLEGRVSTDYERYSIDGRSLDRIPVSELHTLRKKYAAKVRREKINKGHINPFKKVKYI